MGQVHAKEASMAQQQHHGDPEGGYVESLDSIGAQVTAVHVDGVKRTKDDIITPVVEQIFKVEHFEDLVLKAQDVRASLQDLGCFSDVGIHIDTAPEGGPKDYEVTFKVVEFNRIVGSVNTMVGNQEGSLTTGVRLPNVRGRGERFQVEYSHGTRKTSTFNAAYIKPFHASGAAFSASAYQQMGESVASGFKELNRGVLLDMAFTSAPHIAHNLQWEGVWRDLRALNRTTAFAVREHAGHTLKSSLRHILTVDRRDNTVFPSEGTLFKLTQEYAGGLGGDVGFFKNEVEVQANVPLLEDIVLQGTFNAGVLSQLTSDRNLTMTIADNFFIGGPLDVRGFDLRGLGPSSDGCSLGGNMFWATGLHVYAPLPFRPGKGGFGDLFRSHMFVTAGNLLGDFRLRGNANQTVEDALQNLRLSYGLGIALKLGGIARVELNYCLPVKFQRGDKPAPGLQLGVGVNFL